MESRCLVCGQSLTGNVVGEYHDTCAKRLFGSTRIPSFAYSDEELNRLATNLIQSRTSVPGVQPKLSVHLEREGNASRLTLVGLEGDYILKLPTHAYAELPESEHFAMTLARQCGIKTATFGLIRMQNGALAYLTRRMDREGGMHHMEDMCQLTEHRSERKYYGSYEKIARQIWKHSQFAGEDVVSFFELVVFSYLVGNSDMHLKNFSLIQGDGGEWSLSPAYDLVPVKLVLPQDPDDLALTLNGKNRNLTERDFRCAASTMHLTLVQYGRVVKRVSSQVFKNLDAALAQSFLSENFRCRMREFVRAQSRFAL